VVPEEAVVPEQVAWGPVSSLLRAILRLYLPIQDHGPSAAPLWRAIIACLRRNEEMSSIKIASARIGREVTTKLWI
jgi:hypothetical protein